MIIRTEILTIFHKIIFRFTNCWSSYSNIRSKEKIFLKTKNFFFHRTRFCFQWTRRIRIRIQLEHFIYIILTLGADRTAVKSKNTRHVAIVNRTMSEDCMIMSCLFLIKCQNEYCLISNVVFIKNISTWDEKKNASICVGRRVFPLSLAFVVNIEHKSSFLLSFQRHPHELSEDAVVLI